MFPSPYIHTQLQRLPPTEIGRISSLRIYLSVSTFLGARLLLFTRYLFFFPHCCFLSLVPVFTAGWHNNKDVEHNVNGYKGGN